MPVAPTTRPASTATGGALEVHLLGLVDFDEPFAKLFTQGMIIKDGAKMSKSKGNVVSPDELINRYGADTVRLYTLFIGPPEKDAEWSDRGSEGAYRFLKRLYRLVGDTMTDKGQKSVSEEESDKELKRMNHATIKKVTDDMEKDFHFNTAISSIMELVNKIYLVTAEKKGISEAVKDAVKTTVILLSPFVPHICEELWRAIGGKESIFKSKWPSYKEEFLKTETVTIVAQVNGKGRNRFSVPVNATEDELENIILKDASIRKWTEDRPARKFIVVQNKLVNIVL